MGEVVVRLKMPQPAVSKHLGVLRKVGVVSVIKRGQHRMYRLNADELKPCGIDEARSLRQNPPDETALLLEHPPEAEIGGRRLAVELRPRHMPLLGCYSPA